MAGYSGAWRRTQTRTDGSRYTDPAPVLGRPDYAEQHMEAEPDEGGSRPPWAVVHNEDVPAWLTDPDAAYSATAPGPVYDREPVGDHQDGVSVAGGQTAAQARAQGHAARTRDRGAAREQVHRTPRIRAVDEVRDTEMYELAPISAGSRVAVLRGDNSLPENNPDGYRNGQRVRRWQDRKIPGSGLRRHSAHPLRVNTAAAPNVSPAPAPDAANRYASPFSLNISSKVRTNSRPVARRTPRAWDEDVVTDGSGEGNPTYATWGL